MNQSLFIRSAKLLGQAVVTAALMLLVTACGSDVGDGNRMEFITIEDASSLGLSNAGIELEVDGQSISTARVFRCFPTTLVLIGTFTDGGRENSTLRGTWTSSNPDVVRVSNGDEQSIDGNVIAKGVITPVGVAGEKATITAQFLTLSASVEVEILDGRYEITPPLAEVAQGTSEVFTTLGILDGREVLSANASVEFSVESNGAAEATVLEDSTLVTFDKGGSSPDDYIDIVADPQVIGCEDFVARQRIRVNNKTINRLEIVTENFGVDPDPLVMQQLTQEGLKVMAIHEDPDDASAFFKQDITNHVLREHLRALIEDGERLLESEDPNDPDATTFAGGFLLSDTILILTNALTDTESPDTSNLVVRFDQDTETAGLLEKRFALQVKEDNLLDLTISPSNQNIYPGTSTGYTVVGRYDDGLGNDDSITTQNLRRSVSWSSDDDERAFISNAGGFQGIAVALQDAENGVVNIDAERQNFASEETELIAASDSNGGATLDVNRSNLTSISFDPEVIEVELGKKLRLKVVGDNGQNLSSSVVYTVSDDSFIAVDNLAPRNGELLGRQLTNSPVTVEARLHNEFSDGAVTDLLATATVTVVEPQDPEEPEEPEEPICILPPILCFDEDPTGLSGILGSILPF